MTPLLATHQEQRRNSLVQSLCKKSLKLNVHEDIRQTGTSAESILSDHNNSDHNDSDHSDSDSDSDKRAQRLVAYKRRTIEAVLASGCDRLMAVMEYEQYRACLTCVLNKNDSDTTTNTTNNNDSDNDSDVNARLVQIPPHLNTTSSTPLSTHDNYFEPHLHYYYKKSDRFKSEFERIHDTITTKIDPFALLRCCSGSRESDCALRQQIMLSLQVLLLLLS